MFYLKCPVKFQLRPCCAGLIQVYPPPVVLRCFLICMLWMNAIQEGDAYRAARHLHEVKQLRCWLGTPEPRRKGGIQEAAKREAGGQQMYELLHVLVLGRTETGVKMYQNMSSRIDRVAADDKRSEKAVCAVLERF